MPELAKCVRADCLFEINPKSKNNDGRHCCRACMNNGKHGPNCKGVVFVVLPPPADPPPTEILPSDAATI